jgi:hypothetical protein
VTTTKPGPPHHNNLSCYTEYRCRLPECVERYNIRNRERLRAHRAGTWQVFVDAEPVRQHILRLQAADIGPGTIAVTTGLPIQSVLDFIRPNRAKYRGRRQRTTPETAAKILAVTADNSIRLRVDATGTVRRIQALIAIGWPQVRIARHAGISPEHMNVLVRRTCIFSSTAQAVEAAYDELRHLRPERRGVDKVQAKKARNRAARQRWAPPKYWDQHPGAIGDPDFEPLYGVTRCEQIAQDAHWLMTAGHLNRDQAAARIGVSRFSVDRALREHPQDDAYDQAA